MFKVKAEYSEQVNFKASLERVRGFFADVKNFIELMPSLESIRVDNQGIARWTIRAEIPLLGGMTETFAVHLAENSDERVEWSPAPIETKNFLRYAAEFMEKGSNETFVQIRQAVELRREKASELHLLAGLAGENIISNEMQKRVTQMIKTFLEKARTRLEQE